MQKPILYILVFSALLILDFFFVLLPQYQAFSDLRAEVKGKTEELRNKEEYFSQLESISEELKKYASELAKIESALPLTPNIPNTLNFIGRRAQQSGLVLQRSDIGKIQRLQEESPIIKTVLTMSFSGSYPAFRNFLSKVQQSSRLIEVEEISFTSPPTGEIFSFDLKVHTHSY